MMNSASLKAALLSVMLLGAFLGAWQLALGSNGSGPAMDPEYAALMGATSTGAWAMPSPLDIATEFDESSGEISLLA